MRHTGLEPFSPTDKPSQKAGIYPGETLAMIRMMAIWYDKTLLSGEAGRQGDIQQL